jgi:hypothetical protein
MERWTVRDRLGHEIYMTEERWLHITSKHAELLGHLSDVLDTIRKGRRRQERRDPQRFRYQRQCFTLQNGDNQITAVVVFSFHELGDGTVRPNNFVTTAWGEYIPFEG